MNLNATGDRKDSHIAICLDEDVEYVSSRANGFGMYRFDHDALPEIDKSEVDLSIDLFGKRLRAPLIVGAMTGGTERAKEINRRLALAADRRGIGVALGSQRKMIENPETVSSYALREFAPSLPLLVGNIGAVQLNYGVGANDINRLVSAANCDAINFHLNPLQEAIQPEGDTNFSGLLAKIRQVVPEISVPVLLKEVGSGLSEVTAKKISELPVAGVETAGVGGTSWSKIESLRTSNIVQRSTGELFAQWGVPTAESIIVCRRHLPTKKVIASGGLRNGIEVAKALCLGADAAAFALPMLKAAEKSVDDAILEIDRICEELRTVMFLVGARNIDELKQRKLQKTVDYTVTS